MARKHAMLCDYFAKDGNFITPHNRTYHAVGRYAVELSEGEGFRHEPIYGVIVARLDTGESSHALSKCCYSKQERDDYVAELRKL